MSWRRGLASIAAALAVLAVPTAAHAATSFPIGPLSVDPSQGLAGSSFTASQEVSPNAFCPEWSITFDGVPRGTDSNSGAPTRTVSAQVPLNAPPGEYQVVSFCGVGGRTTEVGSARFIVFAPSTTTTSSTTTTTTTTIPSTTTTASTTTTVKQTTTTAKATTTTAKATTTTAKGTTTTTVATTTTAPSTTTTTLASTTTAPTTSTTTDEVRELALDKPSVPPGGDVVATGQGCDPGADVTLEIQGEQVGETTADDDGAFETPIAVPDVDPGRLDVLARCGPILTTELDVVLTSSVTGGQSILLVIAISVMVLFGLAWYALQSRRA